MPSDATLRVLVACEFSGVVRRAFSAAGHDAWSCDLLEAEDDDTKHIVGDVREILNDNWDMLIAHPPCTRLCNSGVRWLKNPPRGKTEDQMARELSAAAAFFSDMLEAPIPRVAVENPIMHKYAKRLIRNYKDPAQIIQPWMFGHGETKATCLWLRGLPLLRPTNVVDGRIGRVHLCPPSNSRWKERSRTLHGIAEAMARQWGVI